MTGPLVAVDQLAARLGDPDLRVVDVRWYLGDPERGRSEHLAGHVPGAVFLDLEDDLSDMSVADRGRHPLPDRAVLAGRLGGLGIGDRHTVVAYDDVGGAVAGRAWWMLRWLGHRSAAVLDGGWSAWIAAGHPVATDPASHPPAKLTVGEPLTRLVGRDGVAVRTGVLLDARSPERWRGEVEPVDPVPGHIPGAVNLPVSALLDTDGRFLPASVLADRLRSAGIADDTIASCGSGVNACALIVAAVAAGLPEPALYPGSFSEWSRAGLPVERKA